MNYILLFLSVIIGYFIATLVKGKNLKFMPIFLAFSGSFLLSVTLLELLPEVFQEPSKRIGIFILLGIVIQICLEFFSKGAEHGHVHLHDAQQKFPWLLLISLSVHAFLEGFPISDHNHLLLGVIVHKIPIAIILSVFFIQAGYKKSTTLLFLFLFAIMTPLGSWVSTYSEAISSYSTEITAITIGVFLHVSTTILFESSKNHTFNLSKMTAVILATVLAYFL
ncbi:MAG: zinc transporter ZupT [Flavobacteriaceae bacterium]|jgi:zinc transporter ZupT|uniref:ZIP family metal transporter n=1 Tax=Candidatus Marifrigoribacter sp. Uisw_064 TaxID=3230970 RepID=UPI003AE017AC